MPRRLQSILAIAAGFGLIVGSYIVLRIAFKMMVEPRLPKVYMRKSDHRLILGAVSFGCCFVITALGSYVTARLAPRRPWRHVIELGLLDLLLSLTLLGLLWHRAPWLLTTSLLRQSFVAYICNLPAFWFGGMLRTRQLSSA